jgi:hypothetical protein
MPGVHILKGLEQGVYLFVELKNGAAIASLVLLSVRAPLEASAGASREVRVMSLLRLPPQAPAGSGS